MSIIGLSRGFRVRLFGLGSTFQGFEHQFSGRLDVLRRSHVAHWNVSGGPCRVSGTGSWSRDELHDAAEVEVPGIAFQHRVPHCLVCVVEEIQALLQFPAIRNRCTSSNHVATNLVNHNLSTSYFILILLVRLIKLNYTCTRTVCSLSC